MLNPNEHTKNQPKPHTVTPAPKCKNCTCLSVRESWS